MATTPPILARATYPPGSPATSAQPKPFGKTPTSINQIMFPDGIKSTHFAGPVVSGPTPGIAGAAGSAILCLTIQVDWSMGNFSIPIQFPGGCFLQSITPITYQVGLGTAAISLGTQTGLTDIANITTIPAEGAAPTPITPTAGLPLWDKTSPLIPFQMWLNVTGNGTNTAGGTIILINYVRLSGPWSGPAQ